MNTRTLLLSLLLIGLVQTGCRTTPTREALTWPKVSALPSEPPEDLQRTAPTTLIRRGGDGFVYVVGGLPDDVATGTPFVARYSGEWPLQDLPRPALASGLVLKRFGRDVAVVQITYALPDTDLEGLEVTWDEEDSIDDLGKGIGRVTTLRPTETSDVQLSLGEELGVQRGDIYAIIAPVRAVDDAQSVQLARRVLGICLVESVQTDHSTCRLWRGSSMVPGRRHVAVNDRALFLEHTYGRAPREAVIKVAMVDRDPQNVVRGRIHHTLQTYVDSFPLPKTRVEPIEQTFDATSMTFHRFGDELEPSRAVQILVSASIVPREGVDHLVVNYTGASAPVGPGMIAAPPEGGVDLGPVGEVSEEDLRALAGIVYGSVLVFRGQTTESLIHLQLLLSDPRVQGPFRWHARDQYAMQWASLGFLEQALWLVLEDEAVALRNGDERAFLNALGTRVRLYDMLERPERALAASAEFLERRQAEGLADDDHGLLFALGMHAEMLLAAEKQQAANEVLQTLRDRCPEGCEGDLYSILASAYWRLPEDADEQREAILTELVTLGEQISDRLLASARLVQGLSALADDRLEDAMIAFLEAERLFAEDQNLPGVVRMKYFMVLTQIARQEPQKAFELAMDTIEQQREIGDFEGAAETYERLAALYTNFDPQNPPGPWLGAARDVLHGTVQVALAQGNYSKAGEASFGLGAFLLRIGELAESQTVLRRSVLFAIRSARFDLAAMSHLWLGLLARQQNDYETFRDEIHRAQVMGEISGDPTVIEAIERVLNPPEENDTPTQVL